MKIRRIDIRAFRVYQEKQKFKFLCNDDTVADLVVIYAPNGFGKTSFTDAVEWAFTSEISRISKNQKLRNTMDLDKKNATDFIYILKNRKSLDSQGTVEITNDVNEKVVIQTRKLDNRMKLDYDYKNLSKNRDIVGNKKFLSNISAAQFKMNNLITSDAINSFLQFDDPEERYRILAEFWDEKGDTKVFEKVINIINMLCKEKNNLEEQIKEKQLRIKKMSKNSIDVKALTKLILDNAKYSNIKFNINKQNDINLMDLKDYYISLNEEYEKEDKALKEKKEIIDFINSNYEKYLEKINGNEKLKNQKKNIDELILVFNQMDNYNKKVKDMINTLKNSQYYLKKLLKLILYNKDYNKVTINNKKIDNQINVILVDKEEKLNQTKNLISIQEKNIIILKNLNTEKEQIKKYISMIDNVSKTIKVNKIRKKYIDNMKIESSNRLERYKEKIAFYESKNKKLNEFKIFDLDNIYDINLNMNPDVECLKNIFNKIITIRKEYNKLKTQLDLYTKEKNRVQEINERNKKIVELGLSIVESNKLTDCPLCGKQFESFNELIIQIKNNSCFEEDMVSNINKIAQLDKNLRLSNKIMDNLLKEFKERLNSLINDNDKIIMSLSENKKKVEKNIRNLDYRLKEIKNDKNDSIKVITEIKEVLKINTNIESFNQIFIQLQDKMKYVEGEIEIKQELIDSINVSIEKNNQIQLKNDNKIEILKNEKNKNLNTESYKIVMDILKEFNLEFNKSKFINDIINLNYEIKLINNDILKLNQKIKKYKLIIENKDKDTLIKLNYDLENTIKENIQYIEQYQIKYFSVASKENNIIDLKIISTIRKKISDKEDYIKKKQRYINRLSGFIQLINLNSEQKLLSQEIDKFNIKMSKLDIKLNKLQRLKDKMEVFLSEKIQNAFNIETINFIYKRIDPNPEFNNIKFVPDFSGNKPKMYIHAYNDNEELSPVLYFSSAQVSILALSIFLAKALLENTFLDTIFMDDPVQHLDSINVLSFIDLIRTIITEDKINKQVVITTNNDMFYRLLQMKLDSDYYKSKFIELKSYGSINYNNEIS